MHYYRKIVERIRKKSFPDIGGRVFIVKLRILPAWAFFIWIFPSVRLILVNPLYLNKLRKYELKAIIAHEFAHAIQGKRWGYFLFWINFFRYATYDKKFRSKVEVEADKMTIDRGYFKGLYSVTKKLKAHRKSKIYMNLEEQKKYYKKK